jgi:SAM-dependent methyltransferase
MEIQRFAENLIFNDGIWYSTLTESEISYSTEGHSECARIENESYWFKHRNNIITLLAKKYCIMNEFIDIGGGNGFVSVALEKAGFETCIIEPYTEGIKRAKANGLKNLINSAFDRTIIKKESISNAGLFDVIEHIQNDSAFLALLHDRLKNGGKLLLTVPSYRLLWSMSDVYARHYRRYTVKSISKLVEHAGFRIVYKSYFFSFLTPLIFIFRSLPYNFAIKSRYTNTQRREEHKVSNGIQSYLINTLCQMEESCVKKNKRILFGSSCIIVAEKAKLSS